MVDITSRLCYNTFMADKPSPSTRYPASPFRSPQTNARWTRQLFWDQQRDLMIEDRLIDPIYTLHHDVPGLVNFRRVYVDLGDPTGYALSQRYLESYDHWLLLMKAPWFRDAKKVWDIELDAKLKSQGMNAIRNLSDGADDVSPAVQLQAAKYLANLEHRKESKPSGRGRPSKEEVQGELKRTAAADKDISDDLARIRAVK